MQQMVNGTLVDVPIESDGDVDSDMLRRAAGVPDDRPLIMQLPDGSNQLVNPGEKLPIKPRQFFMDAPLHVRG